MVNKYTEKDIGDIIRLETGILNTRPRTDKLYLCIYIVILIINPFIRISKPFGAYIALAMSSIVLLMMIKDHVVFNYKMKYLNNFIEFDNIDDFDIYEGEVRNKIGPRYKIVLKENTLRLNGQAKTNLVNCRVNKGDKVEVIEVHARYGERITIVQKAKKNRGR